MLHTTPDVPHTSRVILIATLRPDRSAQHVQEHLKELALLAETMNLEVAGTFTQYIERSHPRTLIGKGKLEEIAAFVQEHRVDKAIFDDQLTPSQLRNLQASLGCAVGDRTLLILDLFAARAKTAQAKTQVALAQYQYLLPRLTKMWSHLSRQRGGAGMKGPGEKELETDRRIVQRKITLLRRKLDKMEQQGETRRQTRKSMPRVALVGYTNAGKSTLMRILSGAPVLAEDKLFATISSTVRRVKLQDGTFLLTDTVGFIRKLPHSLIECFKTTLAEVKESDLLLHIIDVSQPECMAQIQVVEQTLQQIGASRIPSLWVLNKVDRTDPERWEDLRLEITARAADRGSSICVTSALKSTGIGDLKSTILRKIEQKPQPFAQKRKEN